MGCSLYKKSFSINTNSDNTSDHYRESFDLEGVSIENYNKNNSQRIIIFDIRNNWHAGTVIWNISNPLINNNSNLANNQTLMVMIEANYSQGNIKPHISASTSTYTDIIKDYFSIMPLEIDSFRTLSEGTNSVSELVVKNNLNSTQFFSWQFNSGIENLTSNQTINISSDNVFIYIQSNYTDSGVYKTTATINSSSYNDTETGVVVS